MVVGRTVIPVHDYDLSATLASGQAFRWRFAEGWWEGVIADRWVKLRSTPDGLEAITAQPVSNWDWLEHYLQTRVDLEAIVRTFPADAPMQAAVQACRGLRLLRQDPWECLASFILSSTKQIVQIQQVVSVLCERFGAPVAAPPGHPPAHAFPSPETLAQESEAALRGCKMGFRAKHLLAAARLAAGRELDLQKIAGLPYASARVELLRIPGVGPKIADCVLLFAYDFPKAFPVDVWVMRALREWYFPRRRPSRRRFEQFVASHFGPFAGYAQQYLFHYRRRVYRP